MALEDSGDNEGGCDAQWGVVNANTIDEDIMMEEMFADTMMKVKSKSRIDLPCYAENLNPYALIG